MVVLSTVFFCIQLSFSFFNISLSLHSFCCSSSFLTSRFHVEGEPRGASVHYRVGQPAPGDSSSTQCQLQISHYRGRCVVENTKRWHHSRTVLSYMSHRHAALSVCAAIFQSLSFSGITAADIVQNFDRGCSSTLFLLPSIRMDLRP